MPAMVDNCRSIGAATEAAMVSALAPGSVAVIEMVGKVDRRQRRDREQAIGEDAEDDERRRHQRGQDRPADTGLGDAHVRPRPFGARARPRDPFGQLQLTVGHDGFAALQARFQDRRAVRRCARP